MINKEIEKSINKQLNAEIYSASLYYSMASYFEALSLKGFCRWLRIQGLEELTHVQRFFAYVHERGGKITMQAVKAPPTEWGSPLEAFEAVYDHEEKVTAMINAIMDLSLKHSDHATANFLQWFIKEQVEEVASAETVRQKLRLVDKTEGGLFMLDQEMNQRAFVLPPDMVGVF